MQSPLRHDHSRLIIAALLGIYVLAAVVSTPHLAGFYAQYNGSLPSGIAWSIAVALELFVLSTGMVSRIYQGREIAGYAFWGNIAFLLIVFVGNWRSMLLCCKVCIVEPDGSSTLPKTFLPGG